MRTWPFLLMLAACAPSTPATIESAPQAPPEVISTGNGTSVRLSREDRAPEATVHASMDAVWSAAQAAYAEMSIPVGEADRASGTIRSGEFRVSRKLGDHRLSELLECGSGLMGSRADHWRVTLDVTTVVRALGPDSTRIATQVRASARNPEGTSTGAVGCTSTTTIEAEIAGRVRLHVAL